MGYGLFGKLPQKRDFVSVGLPNQVLHPFETWLQSAVAASRNEIGRNWQDYYMVAPIWNFWLGPQVMGVTCAGALMPSVDQVGRYFPLAIIYIADAGEDLPPPLLDPMTDWYREIDQRLLAVLQVDGQLEISSVVAGLPPPQATRAAQPPSAVAASETVPAATPTEKPIQAPSSAAWTAEPVAAAAAPTAASSSGSPWDLPSMSEDAVAAIRMAPGADVEPAEGAGASADGIWQETAAKTEEPPVSGSSSASPEAPLQAATLASTEPAPAARPNGSPEATNEPEGSNELAAAAPVEAEAGEADAAISDTPAAPTASQAAPMAQSAWVAPRIHVTDFKGGLFSIVEPNRSLAEAAGALIEADYRNAAMGRSFWWCETSASGSAQMHTRQGLPDPYFFSRMLMWQAQ